METLYSSMRMVSDGTLQSVTLSFPYTTRTEIHVWVDGLEWVAGWYWADGTGNTIKFDTPVPSGSVVLIRRITQLDEVPYIFGEAAGSRGYAEFSAATVDENFDFILRASQDSLDSFQLTGIHAEAAETWAKRAEAAAVRAEDSESGASASAASANSYALDAAQSASDSAAFAQDSAQQATQAGDSAELSRKWAENPFDEPVIPGHFSAKHWAEVAQDGSDVAKLRQDLADPEKGASLVAAGIRTQEAKNLDIISVRDYILNPVDGVTDNQAGILSAVAAALALGASLYWPAGVYVSSANIPDFHLVHHLGRGKIKRGADIWHITPVQDGDLNILYVTQGAVSSNDGLSRAEPTTPARALSTYLNSWGDKTSLGTWRVQIFGTTHLTANGVRMNNMPTFRNKLQIWGESASLTSVPTTVWDGSTATEPNALRSDQTSSTINVHLRNLKFAKWSGSAVVFWGNINILQENCHLDESGTFGFWYRDGYVRVSGGTVDNAGSAAYCFQYNCSFNLGTASAPFAVNNSFKGVYIGRTSAGHVSHGTFTGIQHNCIDAVMNCRVRTVKNNFVSWGSASSNTPAIHTDDSSVWDNEISEADTFTGIGTGFPAFGATRGSVGAPMYTSGRTPHRYVNTFYSLPAGSGRTLIADSVGYTAPFRFRGVSFYSPSMKAVMELGFTMAVNQGALFELSMGPAAGDLMASVNIPAITSGSRSGLIEVVVLGPQNNSSTSRAYTRVTMSDGTVIFNPTTFSNNNPNVRDGTMAEKLARLYVTPADAGRAGPTLTHLHTYLES